MTKIMVVDDDQIIRERLKKLLVLEDFDAVSAEDGPTALEMYKKEEPAIVLLDVKMPGMDGIEVLRRIKNDPDKKRAEETEVIVITGHGGVDTAIEALREGAFGYIQKPVEFDALVIEISKALERQEMRRKLEQHVRDLEIRSEEAEKAKKESEVANKAKSQFLATMSHEIRTPMNAIIGFVELLKGTNLDDVQKDYVETVSSSGQALLTLINDILDLSKVEAGELTLECTDFDLKRLTGDLIKFLEVRLQKKDVEVFLEIDDDVPGTLIGDPTRIRQILINLVNNAVKFTKQGMIGIKVSNVSVLENGKILLLFVVQDSGIGISREKMEYVFGKFTQADMSTTREYGGTGLGLSICRDLVKLMGGHIWVDSVEGKGSEFMFTIQLEESDRQVDTNNEAQEKEPVSGEEVFKGLKVLVADDNIVNRKLINALLEKMGCMVDLVVNGKEAVDKVNAKKYDICLMDLQMPVMSGLEALEVIRNTSEDTSLPVVALTAEAMKEDEDNALSAGMNGYLTKPIDVGKLKKEIQKWARRPGEENKK